MNLNGYHIIGKCAVVKDQLDRTKEQFDEIEIQLLWDFASTNSPEDLFKIIKESGLKVSVVHTPLPFGGQGSEPAIENLLNNEFTYTIFEVFRLAEMLADYYNEEMPVVIHNEMNFKKMVFLEDAYDTIKSKIRSILLKYPNTCMCIENMPPIIYKQFAKEELDSYIQPINGCSLDNILIARKLQEDLPEVADRIKVTIDTCHILMGVEVARRLQILDRYPKPSKFFEEAGDLCRVIHLNNSIDLGIEGDTHSTPFTDKDKRTLQSILVDIKKFTPNAIITLEEREIDYAEHINDNKLITLDTIKNILNQN